MHRVGTIQGRLEAISAGPDVRVVRCESQEMRESQWTGQHQGACGWWVRVRARVRARGRVM